MNISLSALPFLCAQFKINKENEKNMFIYIFVLTLENWLGT